MKDILIKKANVHNLKDIDVCIPKNKFIVVTGVSGSGKSSLIHDILYKEGQKFYLEALGMPQISGEKHCELIKGLCAVVAAEQKTLRFSNPRSTVGTKTKLLYLLQSLFCLEGTVKCECDKEEVRLGETCVNCGVYHEPKSTSFFSFNSLKGMCFRCNSRGYLHVPSVHKIIGENNMLQFAMNNRYLCGLDYNSFFKEHPELTPKSRFNELSDTEKNEFLNGNTKGYTGVLKHIQDYEFMMKNGSTYDYHLSNFGVKETCPECNGYKINKDVINIHIKGRHIGNICEITITELREFLSQLLESSDIKPESRRIISDIISYADYFDSVGLSYISAGRTMPTLSGGEAQRIFIMNLLNNPLNSLLYVFDEPTAGMHEREKEILIDCLFKIKNRGNTVVVIEHDKSVIEKAEHIIEIGPYAGINGGELIFSGQYVEMLNCAESVTGNNIAHEIPSVNPAHDENIWNDHITISNADTNNLKNVSVKIPLNCVVAVCGVSGSGKSSLIIKTLIPLMKMRCNISIETTNTEENADDEEIENISQNTHENINAVLEGGNSIQDVVFISQDPIGRNMRSVFVTYLEIYDAIRQVFASSLEQETSDLTPGDFSFNSTGACEQCEGTGFESYEIGGIEINYTCSACDGTRFKDESLEIFYICKNIHDVLEMSVTEAAIFFKEHKKIYQVLKLVDEVGLGYIKLGQPTLTLSGGEAQRLKIVKELGKLKKGHVLYVLDEPTTGLSSFDVKKLEQVLEKLINTGNSIIICEHDISLLSRCDYFIELGPVGGHEGGYVIAKGSLNEFINDTGTITGKYIKKYLYARPNRSDNI